MRPPILVCTLWTGLRHRLAEGVGKGEEVGSAASRTSVDRDCHYTAGGSI
jgi:hypothetical protein